MLAHSFSISFGLLSNGVVFDWSRCAGYSPGRGQAPRSARLPGDSRSLPRMLSVCQQCEDVFAMRDACATPAHCFCPVVYCEVAGAGGGRVAGRHEIRATNRRGRRTVYTQNETCRGGAGLGDARSHGVSLPRSMTGWQGCGRGGAGRVGACSATSHLVTSHSTSRTPRRAGLHWGGSHSGVVCLAPLKGSVPPLFAYLSDCPFSVCRIKSTSPLGGE